MITTKWFPFVLASCGWMLVGSCQDTLAISECPAPQCITLGSTLCSRQYDTCKGVASKNPRAVVTLASGLEVLCDTQTEGGGWTMIQRRMDGRTDFYRGWEEYKYGFGDLGEGEFYLGNENIHQLTRLRRYELRIDMRFKGVKYFAKYARFRLNSELDGYRLEISGFSGNATDGLLDSHTQYSAAVGSHNNQRFSTFDKDNDSNPSQNCAQIYHGAWWYAACHNSNLNGLWGSKDYGRGLNWVDITGAFDTLDFTEMKIRPIA
ncbi:ficolin-1-like [Physella acuta]|uniref:ficolin-1-like n=1 Tax=Physella acuta TaxID=109671 RepID=UPI0027DC4325|nr:ficolin-1-like [Physella acuta]